MISLLSYHSRVRQRRHRLIVAAVALLALGGAMLGGWLTNPAAVVLPSGQAMAAAPRTAPTAEDPESQGIVLQGVPTDSDDRPAKSMPVRETPTKQSSKVSVTQPFVAPTPPPVAPVPAAAPPKPSLPTIDTLLQDAETQRQLGNLGSALEGYDAILSQAPAQAAAMAGKLAVLNDGTQYETAATLARSWLQANAADQRVLTQYVRALSRLSGDTAEQTLQALVREHPDFTPAAAALHDWQARFSKTTDPSQ
jgi:hypothetical protein